MTERKLKTIISQEQLQRRVRDMARQVTKDYADKTVYVVSVIENAFVFTADLVRGIQRPVICEFVKPYSSQKLENNIETTEIFYSPEMSVEGRDVLIVEGVLHTGITTEFLIRNFLTRGASSVRLATLLDRQSQRRVPLQPDYFGFLVDDLHLVGYGLADPQGEHRNLAHVAAWGGEWPPE
jgi:hypoxanthine phosphoribosyltransferase